MLKNKITINTQCPFCGNIFTHELPLAGFVAWENGATVQTAFPDLDENTREQLISGICPSCWDNTFPADDEEDFEDFDDCDYEVGFDPYLGCYSDDC